jgi:hypothetical protein
MLCNVWCTEEDCDMKLVVEVIRKECSRVLRSVVVWMCV